MTVSLQIDEGLLREQIWRSLRLNLNSNACFIAERLCAQNNEEENAYVLAVTYHRLGKPSRAKEALRGRQSEQCRYLLAQCYIELGDLVAAEKELLGSACGNEAEGISYDSSEYQNRVPNGAAGFYLLGHVCRLSGRGSQAVKHLKTALELNPFLWSAYEELCQLGADDEVKSIVSDHTRKLDGFDLAAFGKDNDYVVAEEPNVKRKSVSHFNSNDDRDSSATRHADMTHQYITPPPPLSLSVGISHPSSSLRADSNLDPSTSSFVTPSDMTIQANNPLAVPRPSTAGASYNITPSSPSRNFDYVTPPMLQNATVSMDEYVTPEPPQPAPKVQQNKGRRINYEGKIRKVSGRLFGEPMQISPPSRSVHAGTSTPIAASTHKTRVIQAWTDGGSTHEDPNAEKKEAKSLKAAPELENSKQATPVPFGRKLNLDPGSNPNHAQKPKIMENYSATMYLFGQLAQGLAANCKYRSNDAIEIFKSLPHNQCNTAWVQCQLAKANFELVKYEDAAHNFKEARRIDRYRLEDLEIYSTVLWHMKKETDLMYLAHELMGMDRLAPQAWCVLGNCFSLQKEHETALQFFQRALQLDPRFTYAHTLCGHEYFANEDFVNSLRCYRNAIRIDPQHYNAWYGIGQIYYKQEKYEMTEYHYRRALEINRNSSVLRCCLGKTLHKMGCTDEALELLDEAVTRDPKNAIAKYERAVVLFSNGLLEQALQELESLKDIAPREPNLFFLLGKTCKRLGRIDQAMAHFCFALDLKPSSADIGIIKSAIEKLKLPESDEEL